MFKDTGSSRSPVDPGGVKPRRQALEDLLARVEAAEGPSRKLDTAIAIALRVGAEGYPAFPLGSFKDGFVQADMGHLGWSVGWHIPALTASLDAALALLEKHRPQIGCYGWEVELDDEPVSDPFYARLAITRGYPLGDGPGGTFSGSGPNAPLAVIAALLKALLSSEDQPIGLATRSGPETGSPG